MGGVLSVKEVIEKTTLSKPTVLKLLKEGEIYQVSVWGKDG
jgi:excisionase family DNA binding protein